MYHRHQQNSTLTRAYLILHVYTPSRNFFLRITCGRWHCCPENNTICDDRTNGAVLAKNTEHNRNISHVPPTELEMVEPEINTNDKTKLFDGENNLKVISNNSFKPTTPSTPPSVDQPPTTTLSVNTINGNNESTGKTLI